jgi:general secretion pathway protein G
MAPARREYRAFTLIELLLVMVILVVLAGMVVPRFVGQSQKARINAAKGDISVIETALSAFETQNGRFPTSSEGLQALLTAPGDCPNWQGPYLAKGLPNDPWGHPYIYRWPSQHNIDFDLYSCGPDGQDGAAGNIVNWPASN